MSARERKSEQGSLLDQKIVETAQFRFLSW